MKAPRAVLLIRIRVKVKNQISMNSRFRSSGGSKMELWRAVYNDNGGGEAQKWSRGGAVDKW
jgi:hypothetical protein